MRIPRKPEPEAITLAEALPMLATLAAYYVPLTSHQARLIRILEERGLAQVGHQVITFPWGKSEGPVATITDAGRKLLEGDSKE